MEIIIETTVGFLLQNVLQLIKDNHALISNNGTKVDELSKNIRKLKMFMDQYTEKHYQNKILTDLANDIRNLVYEVEDVMETYIVNERVYKNMGTGRRILHGLPHLKQLSEVGETIQKLSEKVKVLHEENKDISAHPSLKEEFEKTDAIPDWRRDGEQGTDRIIGFEDAADEVIELLMGRKPNAQGTSEVEQQKKSEMDEQPQGELIEQQKKSETDEQPRGELKQLEVGSIVGMLGLGKTTLARKVMNDPRVEYHFFTRLFVSVSNVYKREEVLLSILSEFDKTIRDQKKSESELVEIVKEKLKNRYLIVLDDVWDIDVWDDLKGTFPNYNKGSRVLITTRNNLVAENARTHIEPYKLRFMTTEEGRELLRIKVFGENNCPEYLKPIESRILVKCKGLPLAIVVTAGILRNDRDNEKWWGIVFCGADDFGVDDNKKQTEKTEKLIRLSFDNLPSSLKPCFLYLGVFPEDMEIKVSKLLRLWIAEGFIPQSKKETSLETIAESYLTELVNRNLVMVGRRTLNGKIKTAKVHDTLRDFCKRTAQEQNLFLEIDQNTKSTLGRRLCCPNSHISGYFSKEPSAENARSFLTFSREEALLRKELCSHIFEPFKLLRVLDILCVRLTGRLPKELPYLVLLKYIAIYCDLKILPDKMSKLLNLQTIIVHTINPTLEIKADIWRMPHLRHIHTNTSTLLPKCQGQPSICENLQTLTAISPESLSKDVFERAKNLKKLGILGNLENLVEANGESSLFDSISKLKFFENLKLYSDDINSKLPALPPVHKFPKKLKKLSLEKTGLEWTDMSILGKLNFLEILKLKDNAFMGNNWTAEDEGFPSLTVLSIGATDLISWKAEATSFPKLRCLVLKQCNILEAIPRGFADIKHLEMISLEHMSKSAVDSARRIVELQLKMLRQKKDTDSRSIKLDVYPPE